MLSPRSFEAGEGWEEDFFEDFEESDLVFELFELFAGGETFLEGLGDWSAGAFVAAGLGEAGFSGILAFGADLGADF